MRPASSTSVGSGSRPSAGGQKSPRGSGGGLKQRIHFSVFKCIDCASCGHCFDQFITHCLDVVSHVGYHRRTTSQSSGPSRAKQLGGNAGSMWKFYTGDDSPGIKVGPVPVLVMSLLFIVSVFLLHVWGKYTK